MKFIPKLPFKKIKTYQVVIWPDYHGVHFIRLDPEETNLALIYEWCFFIGYLEIRKWTENILSIKENQNAT